MIHKLVFTKNTTFIDIIPTKIYLMESKWLTSGLNKGILFHIYSSVHIVYRMFLKIELQN